MNTPIFQIFLILVCVFSLTNVYAQYPPEDQHWQLVWKDDFHFFDSNRWEKRHDYGRHLEWFNRDNVDVCAGHLILKADQETRTYASFYPGTSVVKEKNFSGSEISTNFEAGNFKYGFFEARMLIPEGKGFFPAFWLSVKHPYTSSENSTWPPEIDVVEFFGQDDYEAVGTLHTSRCSDEGSDGREAYRETLARGEYHTYGVEWNEKKIMWYLDGVRVDSIEGEIPHDFLRIVVSLQIHDSILHNGVPYSYNYSDFDRQLYVDWVRVYQHEDAPDEHDYPKWKRNWYSGITEKLGEWDLSDDDIHVVGNFSDDSKDEVLSIAEDGSDAMLHKYTVVTDSNDDWERIWGENSNGKIESWESGPNDTFLAGNFKADPNNRDELLCINTIYSKILEFDGNDWKWVWGNEASKKIGTWSLNAGDRYYVGDFDGNGTDDLLCISGSSKWAQILTFGTNGWETIYSNGGEGVLKSGINSWVINPEDEFIVGNFEGALSDELLMINAPSKAAKVLRFKTYKEWEWVWGNILDGTIGTPWNIHAGGRYYAVDYNNDGKDALFCVSHGNKFEKIIEFKPQGSGKWSTFWGNAGSYEIHNREIGDKDDFYFGNFGSSYTSDPRSQVLWIKKGWIRCNWETHGYVHTIP